MLGPPNKIDEYIEDLKNKDKLLSEDGAPLFSLIGLQEEDIF